MMPKALGHLPSNPLALPTAAEGGCIDQEQAAQQARGSGRVDTAASTAVAGLKGLVRAGMEGVLIEGQC